MTEEEYFRKTYPDFCYGERPLSPYWDFFQAGVEFGERQSEEKIENLEQQIEKMKCCGNCSHYKKDNNNLYPIIRCEYEYPNRCENKNKWEIKEND